jgi:Spy/CpxP family protein refolding chaperone
MPKRQAIAEARLDLSDLMARKDAGAADLTRAHERLVQARSAMAMAAFDLRMQAREVLTPQQRDKLREHTKRVGEGRSFRRGALPQFDDEALESFDTEPFDLGTGPED